MIKDSITNVRFKYLISCLLIVLISCKNDKINYHPTNKKPVTDVYFGYEVKDNYRWLEDDLSSETEEWVKKQNQTTFKYLNQIPFREDLKNRLLELLDYEKISAPFKKGEYTYFYKNSGLQNQSILYRNLDNQEPEVFLILAATAVAATRTWRMVGVPLVILGTRRSWKVRIPWIVTTR